MIERRRPHRQYHRALRPIGQAVLGADLEPLVADVLRRLRCIRNRTQAGAYLLADAEGNLYVLSEQPATTQAAVRAHAEWIVGLYASRCMPEPAHLREDLIAHFCGLADDVPA